MQHGFRHDHATTGEHELDTPRRPVGRSSLTQRHVARLGDEARADDHARRDAAWLAGPVQRKEKPTAGPSEDDRFGEGPVAANAHGRIIKVDVIGEQTRITIGMGAKQGVHVGMSGYVVAGDGMLCEFQIEETPAERTTHAIVPIRLVDLQGHGDVVINPASRPGLAAPKRDMRARVIKTSVVEGNHTKITIGFGERHGARYGMKGYLTDDSGKPYRRFEITGLDLGVSEAVIEDVLANVQAHSNIVLNPSS